MQSHLQRPEALQWRLTDRGELATEILLQGASGLIALDGGDALLIAGSQGARSLTRVGGNGAAVHLVPVAPGAALAAGPAGILVSDERGIRVLGEGSEGALVARALRPVAPCADGWWGVERGEEGGLLLRLDRNLSRVRTRPLAELGLHEPARLHLAPVSDGGLWIVDSRGEAVSVGPGGGVRARGTLPLPGPQGCVATEEGALLVIVPGAVLRLDPSGRPEPGQGGFDYLVGLAVGYPWGRGG